MTETHCTLHSPADAHFLSSQTALKHATLHGVAVLQERVRFDADALREQARLCPEHVPEVFHFDAQLCLLVMQYLPPPHDVARRALTAGHIYPKLAQHMATFMARTLFGTSLFVLDAKTWR